MCVFVSENTFSTKGQLLMTF